MKKILIAAVIGLAPLTGAAVAHAGPALCGNHAEHDGQAFGNGPGTTYVTACGGDSGPDAFGNNATAPSVDTTAHS